jgi:hypothetical protein
MPVHYEPIMVINWLLLIVKYELKIRSVVSETNGSTPPYGTYHLQEAFDEQRHSVFRNNPNVNNEYSRYRQVYGHPKTYHSIRLVLSNNYCFVWLYIQEKKTFIVPSTNIAAHLKDYQINFISHFHWRNGKLKRSHPISSLINFHSDYNFSKCTNKQAKIGFGRCTPFLEGKMLVDCVHIEI